jgi:hypothetical protein
MAELDEKALEAAYAARQKTSAMTQAELRVMISAYLSALPEQEPVAWQPIQTADNDAERLTLGIARNGVLEEIHIGGYRYAINDDEVSCWWSDQADDEIVPTHWMRDLSSLASPVAHPLLESDGARTVIIGDETIAMLRKGMEVSVGRIYLLPASDISPAEAAESKLAALQPDQGELILALRHDFERIARIINNNLYRQDEKVEDAKSIAIAAAEKIKSTLQPDRAGSEKPFMYGIMCPDGSAYLDEICVDSNDSQTLIEVIEEHELEGHKVVPLYLHPPESSGLIAACSGIDDDYMTSEKHHPGYVLIPTTKFEAIRSALSQPDRAGSGDAVRVKADRAFAIGDRVAKRGADAEYSEHVNTLRRERDWSDV